MAESKEEGQKLMPLIFYLDTEEEQDDGNPYNKKPEPEINLPENAWYFKPKLNLVIDFARPPPPCEEKQ